MEWFGWRKLVFGVDAHRRWHYTGPLGQPNRHVKWFIRSVGAPPPETAINLWHSLVAWVTGTDPPWVEEWREAMEEAEAEEEAETEAELAADVAASDSGNTSVQVNGGARPTSRALRLMHLAEQDKFETHALGNGKVPVAADDHDGASTTSSVRSARALARYKRLVALSGFIGVYVSWALFSWFIFVRYSALRMHAARPLTRAVARAAGVRNAHLQAARRPGAAGVCALLGRVVRDERGVRVEGRLHRVAQGRRHPRHAGALLRHANRQLVRGPHRCACAACMSGACEHVADPLSAQTTIACRASCSTTRL